MLLAQRCRLDWAQPANQNYCSADLTGLCPQVKHLQNRLLGMALGDPAAIHELGDEFNAVIVFMRISEPWSEAPALSGWIFKPGAQSSRGGCVSLQGQPPVPTVPLAGRQRCSNLSS